jgi:amino acid permease
MKLQIQSVKKLTVRIRSYSELGMAVLGAFGKKVVDICMVVSQLGFAIAYLIFIGS